MTVLLLLSEYGMGNQWSLWKKNLQIRCRGTIHTFLAVALEWNFRGKPKLGWFLQVLSHQLCYLKKLVIFKNFKQLEIRTGSSDIPDLVMFIELGWWLEILRSWNTCEVQHALGFNIIVWRIFFVLNHKSYHFKFIITLGVSNGILPIL